MDHKTRFDINEAVRHWRTEFGALNSLSAEDLDELEMHLRDRVAALHAQGTPLETAFQTARQRLGSRQQVGAEFAKINPQRVWLERGIWMMAGLLSFDLLGTLSHNLIGNIVLNYGIGSRWNPGFAVMASMFVGLATLAAMAALGGWCLWRKSSWVQRTAQLCIRRPWITGIALVLALRGAYTLLSSHILSSHILDWVSSKGISGVSLDQALMERWNLIGGIVVNAVWAVGLVLLATSVLRAPRGESCLPTQVDGRQSERAQWLERALWMVTGFLLARFFISNLAGFSLLPFLWLQHATSQPAMQQFFGFLSAGLVLTFVAAALWSGWILMTRCPRLNNWLRRTFQEGPFKAALGVTILLNFGVILWLLMQWAGVHVTTPGIGSVISRWHYTGLLLTQQVVPVAVILALLRRRTRLLATV